MKLKELAELSGIKLINKINHCKNCKLPKTQCPDCIILSLGENYNNIVDYYDNLEIPIEKLLKKSKLTKEEFHRIACEYAPSIAEDSGKPEWTHGELNELWEALTEGHWLYINRKKLRPSIGEIGKTIEEFFDAYNIPLATKKYTVTDLIQAIHNLKPGGK